MINFLKDKIELTKKDDVLKLHIIIKCFKNGFNLSDADINSLIELKNSGYNDEFFKKCVDKGYYKSEQTVRNAIAKMTNLGILSYKKRGERVINTDFIPDVQSDKVVVQYIVGNLDNKYVSNTKTDLH